MGTFGHLQTSTDKIEHLIITEFYTTKLTALIECLNALVETHTIDKIIGYPETPKNSFGMPPEGFMQMC